MNFFLLCLVACWLAAAVWTCVVFAKGQNTAHSLGVIGAWLACLVLAALWQADAVPWLWVFLKGVLSVWLGAIALLLASAVLLARIKQPGLRLAQGCAVSALAANVAAGMYFLWQATVSGAGV